MSRRPGTRPAQAGWAALVGCLLLVAGSAWAKQHLDATSYEGVEVAGVGRSGAARAFSARVEAVRLAHAIASSSNRRSDARGTWVVVTWTLAAPGTSAVPSLGLELLTDDGRVYLPDPASNHAEVVVQPGFVATVTTVFDVPPSRLSGAVLSITPRKQVLTYDLSVRVPLGLTAALPVLDSLPPAASPTQDVLR